MIVLNGIFLVMKFHSNFKDHYKAKLKSGLTLRIFAIILNFIGIIFQIEIGNNTSSSSFKKSYKIRYAIVILLIENVLSFRDFPFKNISKTIDDIIKMQKVIKSMTIAYLIL